jgi:YVTN family beta-propeller protein
MRVVAASTLVGVALWAVVSARGVAAPAQPSGSCPNTPASIFVPLAGPLGQAIFDPACQYVYLTNTGLNRVEIFSLQTLALQAPIQVGAQPIGADLSPDGSLLYVANSGGNNISVIDLAARTELRRITVPNVSGQFSPLSIAVAGNGTALVTTSNSGSGSLRQMNLGSEQIVSRTGLHMTEQVRLRASQNRQRIVLAVGDISSGPVDLYRAETDDFVTEKQLATYVTDAGLDATGDTLLISPGSWILDNQLSMSGTVINPNGVGGTVVDPTRGIGYRSVSTRIDVLNLSTFLKIGELPIGDSVSTTGFFNSVGSMAISQDGSLVTVLTNNGFAVVRPLDTAPQDLNLVRNGNFGSGVDRWATFATPGPGYIQSDVTNGVFRFNRLTPPPGTANQAVIFQETGMALPAGAPIQARFDLGNSSSVRKRISVLLIESNFSDISVCTFWVPPNAPLATYRMRSHTTKPWSNAAIYFYAATDGSDGGYNLIDDVSLQYDTSFANDATECVDPTAPPPVNAADGPEMLVNGDFSSHDPAPWQVFGTMTAGIVSGVMQFVRETDTPPAGVVLQSTGQTVTAGEILTASFDLGNSSTVRKRVTVLLHDLDFSDLSACTFWLEPGQPLSSYAMRSFATKSWANATLSFYAATIGVEAATRLDNVSLKRTPSASISGVSCLEPASGGPAPAAAASKDSIAAATAAATAAGIQSATTAGVPATSAVSVPVSTGSVPASPANIGIVEFPELLDLTGAASARVMADSWLSGAGSGVLQVSVDGLNWTTVAGIGPSDDWAPIDIDLTPWTGGVVALRIVHFGEESQLQGTWRWKNLRVIVDR